MGRRPDCPNTAIRMVLGGLGIRSTELYDLSFLRIWLGRLFFLESCRVFRPVDEVPPRGAEELEGDPPAAMPKGHSVPPTPGRLGRSAYPV